MSGNAQVPGAPSVLENVLIVNLDVHIWSGSSRLKAEDLGPDAARLPPEDLASLGSKRIYPRETLAEFLALKKKAERLLASMGVRFIGGMTFAIAREGAQEVVDKLKDIQAEFLALKAKLRANYAFETDQWIKQHPGWEDVIRRAVVPLETVTAAISFAFHPFQIKEASLDASAPAGGSAGDLCDAVGSLNDRLFAEVARDADELWKRSLVGKSRATRRTLSPVRNLRHKLELLSFVDPRVPPVVAAIDGMLAKLPREGPFEGQSFTQLMTLVSFMSDTDKMKQHGEMLLADPARSGETDRMQGDVAAAGELPLQALPEPAPDAPEEQQDSELPLRADDDQELGDFPPHGSTADEGAQVGGWFY